MSAIYRAAYMSSAESPIHQRINQVLLLSQWLLAALLLEAPGDVTGQFSAPLPTCPGDTFTFRCNVTGDRNGITIWKVGGSSECTLAHSTAGASSTCGPSSAFTAIPGAEFGTSATSFTSTLSGTATFALNGTLVECFGPNLNRTAENRVGKSTFWILGPPSVPTLSCVGLSEVNGAVNVTVSWTLSGGNSADFYLINITTNAPQTPYEGLLNITNASVTQHELTGFMAVYKYDITVHGVNCESQEGREGEPLIIKPQVPAILNSCNITSLLYNQLSGRLLFIDMNWDSMPNQIDPGEACPSPRGDVTQYQINFQTASSMVTVNVSSASCTAGRCSHTFMPPSNPSSSYDSVSMAAVNVVGVGAPSMCTTQPININNNLLAREVVDVSSPSNATVNCTFLSGFTGSAHCTVQYGTDPTYMNLPYSAESTETGTAGDTVSVVLRERLNSSTVYYYTVSAGSGDVTLRVRGNFTTPQYSCSAMELWNLPAVGATFFSDATLLDDATQYPSCDDRSVGSVALVNTTLNTATVIYYTGTTPGSRACFVCDEGNGYEPTNNERICQSNSTWSGSPTMCVCTLSPRLLDWHYPLIVIGALFLVIGVAVGVVGMILIIIICNQYDEQKRDQWKKKLLTGGIFCVIGIVLSVIGVPLWIAVGVVVANPPYENVCNPNWHLARDGLIVAGLVVSSLVPICTIIVIFLYWAVLKTSNDTSNTGGEGNEQKEEKEDGSRVPGEVGKLLIGQKIQKLQNRARCNRSLIVQRTAIQFQYEEDKNHFKPTSTHLDKINLVPNPGTEGDDTTDDSSKKPLSHLHKAAKEGDLKHVKSILEQGTNVNKEDDDGMTPLHMATEGGHTEIVKYLVGDLGADFKRKIKDGRTPLHMAAGGGHVDIVRYLVEEKSADINAKNKDGVTAPHKAAKGGHEDIVKHPADNGAYLNTIDNKRRTPLHMAAEGGYIEIVRYLVDEKRADINVENKLGSTPLHVAAEKGHTEIVKYLVDDKSADVNIKDRSGRTPLLMAAKGGHMDTMEYLVGKDAVVTIKDKDGETPLHMAAEQGDLPSVKFLVEKEADINVKTVDKRTPLYIAARRGHVGIVRYLVGKEATINTKEKRGGLSPLSVAVEGGHMDIVRCLVDNGAHFFNMREKRKTLDIAAKRGRDDIVECLKDLTAIAGSESVTFTSDGNGQHASLIPNQNKANDQADASCLSESKSVQQSGRDAPAETNQEDIALLTPTKVTSV